MTSGTHRRRLDALAEAQRALVDSIARQVAAFEILHEELRAATEEAKKVGDDRVLANLDLPRVGDDRAPELANADLQTALQQQQQTLVMLSNVSKQLHDSAMAVIRKIGS